MKNLLSLFLTAFVCTHIQAQVTLDAEFGDIRFGGTGVTITHEVGDGDDDGDVTLYENVITIGGTQVDAIIRTVSISGNDMTDFDNPSTSGTGMSNNDSSFFSPQFDFGSGGGNCLFQIEFIEGGSYDTSTHTGTLVILANVAASTYDIDGNGNSNSNQFNEYGGFSSVELSTSTNLVMSYNHSTGLTTFESNTSSNITNVLADETRVRVTFEQISVLTFNVGAGGSGLAYSFIDFSGGGAWTGSTDILLPPDVDLNTNTPGLNNIDTFCTDSVYFTRSGTNILNDNNDLDELIISINSLQIQDGSNEVLGIAGASLGARIALDFGDGASISNINFKGNIYTVNAVVSGGRRTLRFSDNGGGTMALSDVEELLDSIYYLNHNASTGLRIFDISVRYLFFVSPPGQFIVDANCAILPVTLTRFKASLINKDQVLLEWTSVSEYNCAHYIVQRSKDMTDWSSLGTITGAGNSFERINYHYYDQEALTGIYYYRLIQVDLNGKEYIYPTISINNHLEEEMSIEVYPNPGSGIIQINLPDDSAPAIEIMDQTGLVLTSEPLIISRNSGLISMDISFLPKGMYFIQHSGKHIRFVKQ